MIDSALLARRPARRSPPPPPPVQLLLETPWSHAMGELVHPETRGERPPDLEQKLRYGRALVQLAAEDPEIDRTLSEVRALLRPFSALQEPKLANRVKAVLAEMV